MDFKKLTVIDASTVLAGPSVGMFFAELGARVIKIEHPQFGDVTRTWKLPSESKQSLVSAYFCSVNYNKEYIKLDYTQRADYEQFLKLVEQADILLTNFKRGDDQKFGLTDEILSSINKQLIHGKISGFGSDSDRVAYDLILQAETGFMSINGTEDSGPVKMPVALIDVLAAHQLKEGILVALLKRSSDKKGRVVSVSLYEAAIASLVNQATNYLQEHHVAKRMGSLHPNIAPYGEIFKTKDNQQITFAIGSDAHFEKLCHYLGLNELVKDEWYAHNQSRVIHREKLQKILQEKIKMIECDDLLSAMHQNHVPIGKIKMLDEVLEAPEAKGMVLEEEIEKVNTKRIKSIAFHIK